MKAYAIGLDIGITSVGSAILALDSNEQPCGIIDMGVRIFEAAEVPKTGKSLAAPRREARSTRRRLRRHRHRNERIKNLIINKGILSKDELQSLFERKLEDIYFLRVRALDEKINEEELARILIHLSQRRGFKSNRKNESSKEEGKMLKAINENKQRMEQHGYRSVAEMLLKDEAFKESKRNKGGQYITTITRDMVEDEVHLIFKKQREYNNVHTSEELEKEYLDILLSQRSFDEGPGEGSPYAGNQIEKMIGKCTFFKEKPRAAKASYSFEYFNLLEKINHIRLIGKGEERSLSDEERQKIINLAHQSPDLTYSKIRKALDLSKGYRFNMLRYFTDKSIEDIEKKQKFNFLKAYHEMRVAFDRKSKGSFEKFSNEQRNEIGTALSIYKTSDRIKEYLKGKGFSDEDIETIEDIKSFSKFGHLSIEACDQIIPFLEKGMNYNEACESAEINFKGHTNTGKKQFLHPTSEDYESITSPVVRRAVVQSIKVINAIIQKQGCSPSFINIELAREMSKNLKERNEIRKENENNQANNERLRKKIKDEHRIANPSGIDIVKLKLWEEQDGRCAYSLEAIPINQLFTPNFEIDHIIPYSVSFDDSYKNKVLVFKKENQEKGKRLPLQYLTGKKRDEFIIWVNNNVKNFKKKQNLLKEKISEEDKKNFKERNLQDTKTISRFLYNYINDNLEFAASTTGKKKKVTAVNGIITSYMRKRLGINKIRENGDLHHAVDAVVIACTTDKIIQEISRYSELRECQYTQDDSSSLAVNPSTGEIISKFPQPWHKFRKELEARLSSEPERLVKELKLPFYMDKDSPIPEPIFVSRMPNKKVKGEAHEATARSKKDLKKGYTISKTKLTSLSLDKQTGEINNYYEPESDSLLYRALKERLKSFGGDAKKAFKEPFHKPKKDGSQGPIVRTVKTREKSSISVDILGGNAVAKNSSRVRIDVFHIENDGYYFVPIYVADTIKEKLPSKAVVAHKPYEQWKEMRDEDFIFSLYHNDLLKVSSKKEIELKKIHKESSLANSYKTKSEYLYYISADISDGSISCCTHDNTYEIKSLGIKKLEKLEKYSVDVLGKHHKINEEKRQAFNIKRD